MYLLVLLQKAFFGSSPKALGILPKPNVFAYFPATVLAFSMVGLGLFPNLMTGISAASVTALAKQMQSQQTVAQTIQTR